MHECVPRSSRIQRQECSGQRWANQVAASMVALTQMAESICLACALALLPS